MAFDSLGRYAPTHKAWDHVGNMIPVVEHSEGVRPHGEFRPATWLPVTFFDKHYEEYFVIMPGKILACDNNGHLVPAQYGLSGATITYTDRDVEAGVTDVRTGKPLLSADTGSVNVADVDGSTHDFLGQSGVALSVSDPLGVAPYAYWQWGGDGSSLDSGFNPAAFRKHNHNLQHQVAILCDYVLELPLVPASASSEALEQDSFADNVLVLGPVNNLPVAQNTVRTPVSFSDNSLTDSDTRFVREVDSQDDVKSQGDWYFDLETGFVYTYAASDPSGGATAYSIDYYHYASAPSSVSSFTSAVGNLKCGDFLVCDENSNFKVAAGGDNFRAIMGQVLEVEDVLGKDALSRVRTAYDSLSTDASGALPGYAGQLDQMPGSATGGAPDKVHYAGASNLVVRVNLVSR